MTGTATRVAAEHDAEQIGLLRLRRIPVDGARWTSTIMSGESSVTDPFVSCFSTMPGRSTSSHRATAEARAERRADRSGLVLLLKVRDAEVLVTRKLLEDGRAAYRVRTEEERKPDFMDAVISPYASAWSR